MKDIVPPLIRMQVKNDGEINPFLVNNLIITQRNFQDFTNNINSDHQNNKKIPTFVLYFLSMMRGSPLLLLFIGCTLLFCCAIFIIHRFKYSSIKVKKCKNSPDSEILNP